MAIEKSQKEQIDDLYEYNEIMLDNWYRDYHEKYPNIINSFKRYLRNKDEDDDLIKRVKDEILLMLYNQRDLVIESNENNKKNELNSRLTEEDNNLVIPCPT